MVDLHQGSIEVSSKENRTTFAVNIPLITGRQTEEPAGKKSDRFVSCDEILDVEDCNKDSFCLDNKNTLLVIDDNEEIRFYIYSIFKNKYHIMEASDGEEGLRIAYENNVDIIISDIMMPKIDGIELCTKIKEDIRVCHIPMVLLTACSLDEQCIKGFESGADAYISKPFNPRILAIRIQKMLENRQKIRKHLTERILSEKQEAFKINTLDDELILKLKNYILVKIADTHLNVEDISSEFGFSRSQFYRKMKAITNQGPNEFIRMIRLNKSVEILKTGKTVSEVAYEVGFTSPAYFTKCFKAIFHKNPSEI